MSDHLRTIALDHAARHGHGNPDLTLKAALRYLDFLEGRKPLSPPEPPPAPADLPFGFGRYRSHKTVWADQIDDLRDVRDGSGTKIACVSGAAVFAEPGMFERYTPVPGDYLVIYEDGYRSISPKAAFENGYTKL